MKALEKGLQFKIDFHFPLPRFVITDTLRLKQILINLVGNAIKFTEKGEVKVSVQYFPDDGCIEFAVIDTGPGISLVEQEKLFKTFSQADSSTTRRYGGTGLGLVISKKLARMLGADIVLQSSVGLGSVFTLKMPCQIAADSEICNQIPLSNEIQTVPKKYQKLFCATILIAEDSADNKLLMTRMLEKLGIQVRIVADGEAALRAVLSFEYDLVFMDIQMPVMDGCDTIRKIRATGNKTPVIAWTADVSPENQKYLKTIGFNDILFKPISYAGLCLLLDKYLEVQLNSEEVALSSDELKEHQNAFLSKLPQAIEEIRIANSNDNFKSVARLSHTLIGAGMLGFQEFSLLAKDLESAALKEDSAEISVLIDKMRVVSKQLTVIN